MNTQDKPSCPKCGASIPGDAPSGLCPKCVLEGVATVAGITPGGRKSAPPGIAEIALHFPELEILELIGVGGMGAVYKARQPQLDRFVAVKILSHELGSDPAFVERFNREARVLGRLSHPNIVGIHDFGTAGPYCYLLMEYVDGVNLRQAMRAGRFTPNEALEMVQHLCSALKFAHEEGILHRDIKPENILIDSKGRIKIADFGIAKLVGEDRQHDVTLTLQGSVLGSPHYMAPEQIETPGDVDQRADIYSLGVVLYEMLTGGLPIGRFAPPSEKASMDARIDHIVMRTLEKEREARYQSAGEVSTEVEALAKHPASAAAKVSTPRGEAGAARFSLTAAILTGISIPLVIISIWLFKPDSGSMRNDLAEPERTQFLPTLLFLLAVFCILVSIGSAIIGWILGLRALGEIRRSGGVRTGLGSAIFATMAWPILALLAVGQLFMKMPTPGVGGSIGPFMFIFVVLIPVALSACLLARSLYRWAGGVERKDGTRFHPGLGMPLLAAMLLAIGGPVLLAEIVTSILPARERRDPYADFVVRHSAAMSEAVSIQPTQPQVPWRADGPEVEMPIIVKPGRLVIMNLVLRLPEKEAREFDLGLIVNSNDEPGDREPRDTEILQIGTYLKSIDGKGDFLALAANLSGGNGETIQSVEDFTGWEFNDSLPDALEFDATGREVFTIATLAGEGGQERAGVLTLEVTVNDYTPAEELPESR